LFGFVISHSSYFDYTLYRATSSGVAGMVQLVQGDFMKLPFADNTFDGCFAIESTCHAPDRTGVYSEIFRVLKVENGKLCHFCFILSESFFFLF